MEFKSIRSRLQKSFRPSITFPEFSSRLLVSVGIATFGTVASGGELPERNFDPTVAYRRNELKKLGKKFLLRPAISSPVYFQHRSHSSHSSHSSHYSSGGGSGHSSHSSHSSHYSSSHYSSSGPAYPSYTPAPSVAPTPSATPTTRLTPLTSGVSNANKVSTPTPTPTPTPSPTRPEVPPVKLSDIDNGGGWGWFELVGLLGLLGFKKWSKGRGTTGNNP